MLTANKKFPSWPLRVDVIAPGSVDIWCVSVRSLEQRLEALASLLTREEVRRAKAFKFERHRRRFCISRGMLRALLGEYLGWAPGTTVPLAQGAEGKPALAPRLCSPLHFNVSHSADLLVYAFCNDAEIGADVEYLDRTLEREPVVDRAFSPAERTRYYEADANDRLRVFYHIWARKEARLKAQGLSMAQLGDEFLNSIPVLDFTFGSSYAGAVAVARRDAKAAPSAMLAGAGRTGVYKAAAVRIPYTGPASRSTAGRSPRQRAAEEKAEPYIYFE
jgi:4'-phosphopantetheinyl transferase